MLLQREEPEPEFVQPAAIAIPSSSNTTFSKSKIQRIVNKQKKKDKNPLLSSSDQQDIDEAPRQEWTNERIHTFKLITNTSKTAESPSSKHNVYCLLCVANSFLIGSCLLFAHDILLHIIAILMIVIGATLNIYTIWIFCGERLCPRFFKHENELVFDDDEKKIYIHWDGLIKKNTVKYKDFSGLNIKESADCKFGIIYIGTANKHYRFNKYFCRIDRAKTYVATVNNWFNVDRAEQREKMYNHRSIMLQNIKLKYEQKEEEKEVEKTEEQIYDEDEEELGKLIKNLKYKSFREEDIESACKLAEYFQCRYRVKMVEEYQNIKTDLEQTDDEMILTNKSKYIASALLLKVDTMDQLIQTRKQKQLQMMINENKRNKIHFSDDDAMKKTKRK